MKHILIVGAGAVGQVYGYQFAQAGNQVSFLVKEKYQQQLAKGLTLYHLNRDKHKKRPIQFREFAILTDWQQVKAKAQTQPWDQIYFCISSTAFMNFDFSGLQQALSPDTTVVILQSGPKDFELAAQHVPESQLVQGMITLVSYSAPLPGEPGEQLIQPGIAYWLPPIAATPFAGNPSRRTDIVNTFKRANMNANSNPKLREMAPYPTAALMAFLTALEASDWQFDRLKANKPLQREMLKAQQQAFQALSKDTQTKPPIWHHLIKAWLLNLLFGLAPKVVPLDLESFFKVHFTKVKDQTKLYMDTYIKAAESHGITATELVALNRLTD